MLCAALLVAAASLPAQESRGTSLRVPHTPTKSQALPDAAMRGDVATVRKLLAQNADVNSAQGDGMTALHWAAEHGDAALTELLLKAKADVKATTRVGNYTPLHIAAKSGSATVVKALIKAGSDVNAQTVGGATPVHFAATSGSADAINALADAKADLNAKEIEWGQTPLIFAADANRGTAITALLKRGADGSVRSKSVNLNDQAAREQAAVKARNEVYLKYKPKAVRDSITAAMATAAAAGLTPPPGAAPAGGAIPGPDGGNGAGAAGGQGGQGGQGGRPGGGRGQQVSTEGLTSAQIQEGIAAGRKALESVPTGPAAADDTTDGQVAGFAGTVGAMGGMTPLHHAVRQGNL
ncbi:MAG: ankyrin repeat domain-containing protein, partial [bacterium]